MAEVIYKVGSVADCFHFKYCINKLLSLALAAKLRSSRLEIRKAEELKDLVSIDAKTEVYAHVQFYTDLYVDSMANISHILHPFTDGNKSNTSHNATYVIEDELSKIEHIIKSTGIKDKYGLFTKAQNQVNDAVQVIDLWHRIAEQETQQLQLLPDEYEWFRGILTVKYWQQTIKKTTYAPTRARLKVELQKCQTQNSGSKKPKSINSYRAEELTRKASDLCRKFQRASSQVEGRNGHLSLINHNQRGFDGDRLKVLTVVHNFDTKGMDGKTPAQRLFGDKLQFESLSDYIIKNFGDLPMPRKRKPID